MSAAAAACARDLLGLIPHLMQAVRQGMRSGRDAGLSVPQFRTLALVDHQPGTSLADAAAHVGLGAPAMSVLVDGLVERGLVLRRPARDDRRRIALDLTGAGRGVLDRARAAAHGLLVDRLAGLAPGEIAVITAATAVLSRIFAIPAPATPPRRAAAGRRRAAAPRSRKP